MKIAKKKKRDIEKTYAPKQFIQKLRRLADCLEAGEQFYIQVAGERIYVPDHAVFNIAHERDADHEEVEFQLTWKRSS